MTQRNPNSLANLKAQQGKGRPKGTPNKATRAIQEVAQSLLSDEQYVDALVRRLRRGTAGAVEPLLYHYAYGKPKDTVEVNGPNGGPLAVIERRIVKVEKSSE